jgi:hypothetical protein
LIPHLENITGIVSKPFDSSFRKYHRYRVKTVLIPHLENITGILSKPFDSSFRKYTDPFGFFVGTLLSNAVYPVRLLRHQ